MLVGLPHSEVSHTSTQAEKSQTAVSVITGAAAVTSPAASDIVEGSYGERFRTAKNQARKLPSSFSLVFHCRYFSSACTLSSPSPPSPLPPSTVTVVDGFESMGDAGTGPLKVGKYGLVLVDDKSDMPFKVRR